MQQRFLLVGSFALSMLKFRADLLRSVAETGIEVHAALPINLGEERIVEELESLGVTIHKIPLSRTGMNPAYDLYSLFVLYRLFCKVRPQYVLSYTVKPVIFGSIAARLAGIKSCYALITGLGYAFESDHGRGLFGRIVRQMYKLSLGAVDSVIFQNQDDERLFVSEGLIRGGSRTCVVCGSGVDLDYFVPVSVPEEPSFLLIARLLGAKGVREYVAVARRIRSRCPEVTFALVGWIDENNPDSIKPGELDKWIDDGTIQFFGRMDDVRSAIAACSVYVLPSYREGTSRTTLEAMAMGRAIVTTDAPGCRDTVVGGKNGFLVPARSIDDLDVTLTRFIEDPGLAIEMGKKSREIAEEKYDVHKVNEMLLGEMRIL